MLAACLSATACIEEHPDFLHHQLASGTGGDASDSTGSTTDATPSEATSSDAQTSGTALDDETTTGIDESDTGDTTETGDTGEEECTVEVCGILPGCDCCDDDGSGINHGDDPIEGDPCYSGDPDQLGIGVCQAGVLTCSRGVWLCDGEVLPAEEVCNGLDDDCNGAVDDGLGTVTCGMGICQVTVAACVDGEPGECVPGEPEPEELCNGLDDTCDGQIDTGCLCIDGETQSCYTGPQGTLGVGICSAGEQTCNEEGEWGACMGDTTPKEEICNGLDDDCNGEVDDGNFGGQLCDTQLLGECKIGVMQCVNGSMQCVQTTFPTEEVCDGKDNDCNGVVDDGDFGGEDCDTGLEGICADGTMACVDGELQCVQNEEPVPEICGDGLDNNCNGLVDENCGCAHSKCVTGVALSSGCDECVAQICNSMPSCCTTEWTSSCVDAVQTICKCGNCSWGCSHNICLTGGPLVSGCDPGCVADVCAADSYCCNNQWDSICVAQVESGGQFGPPIGNVAGVCHLSCAC